MNNYLKYRGKCKEMSEELAEKDKSLTLVRGYYYEPLWNREEPHWWCKKPCGEIVDPTKLQFPSGGIEDFYREFEGTMPCAECGVIIKEEEAITHGNYACCSTKCMLALVGLG
jgi:hypothetical protein